MMYDKIQHNRRTLGGCRHGIYRGRRTGSHLSNSLANFLGKKRDPRLEIAPLAQGSKAPEARVLFQAIHSGNDRLLDVGMGN